MKRKHVAAHHHENLSSHAKALAKATEHIVDEKVTEARTKLTALIESAKDGWEYIEDKATETAEEADEFVHKKPYQALGIAFGIGTLIGLYFARRK